MALPARAYDPLYDKVYTVSSATDHYRDQTRAGGFGIEKCPDFGNFTSTLGHYPATTFRLKNNDHVPHFMPREFFPSVPAPADESHRSGKATVSGAHRYKFSHKPHLRSNVPLVIVKAAKAAAPRSPTAQQAPAAPFRPPNAARIVGTQSDFRETEAQTDPFSPAHVLAPPSARQDWLSSAVHCVGPEVAQLGGLAFAAGALPGAAEVEQIDKLRAKRAFLASLPDQSDVRLLPLRQKMMEAWEEKEWKEREDVIKTTQDERLKMLQDAILAREAEVEEGHSERVQAVTDRLLASKQDTFASIHKSRIKALRHFTEARKFVDTNRFNSKRSIITTYSDMGSRAYAPLQREGTFPDSKPKGKEIITEHFAPSNATGLDALESFLPRRLLEMKPQVPKQGGQLEFSQRKEHALQTHLDQISSILSSARELGTKAGGEHGGLGHGDVWPCPIKAPPSRAAKVHNKKVVVRNAERPVTPVQAPPDTNADAIQQAAMLLQRLIRGRAIQNDMFEGASFRSELISELLQPLRMDVTAAAVPSQQAAHAATLVGGAVRQMLQTLAIKSTQDRQAALDAIAAEARAIQAEPDDPEIETVDEGEEEVGDSLQAETATELPTDLQAADTDAGARESDLEQAAEAETFNPDTADYSTDQEQQAIKLQAGMRGHMARKRVKALKAEAAGAPAAEATKPDPTAAEPAEDLEAAGTHATEAIEHDPTAAEPAENLDQQDAEEGQEPTEEQEPAQTAEVDDAAAASMDMADTEGAAESAGAGEDEGLESGDLEGDTEGL